MPHLIIGHGFPSGIIIIIIISSSSIIIIIIIVSINIIIIIIIIIITIVIITNIGTVQRRSSWAPCKDGAHASRSAKPVFRRLEVCLRRCALAGVSFSMLSLGWYSEFQHVFKSAEKAEHSEAPGHSYEGTPEAAWCLFAFLARCVPFAPALRCVSHLTRSIWSRAFPPAHARSSHAAEIGVSRKTQESCFVPHGAYFCKNKSLRNKHTRGFGNRRLAKKTERGLGKLNVCFSEQSPRQEIDVYDRQTTVK